MRMWLILFCTAIYLSLMTGCESEGSSSSPTTEIRVDTEPMGLGLGVIGGGIACAQCHEDQTAHAADPDQVPGNHLPPDQAQHNCYTCHARRSFLTAEGFRPGENFHDHFRLQLFDTPGTYYPDGQVRDEDFETASFLSSRMHDGGVRCLDCHNPHSGKLKLPADNNLLCMNCHAPPGRNGAIPILPTAHSRHGPDSAGNRCVECHMPRTEYMQSDLRRDHGFTSPDPLLTRTLGIPNACNRCHTGESVEWAEEWAEEWYGEKLAARRTRPRARAIQDAWDGDPTAGARLTELANQETNVVWKASLIRLLGPYLNERDTAELVQRSLKDDHELIRAAAVHVLAPYPPFHPRLMRLRDDPSRLVRLDAAWATRDRGNYSPEQAAELNQWLRFNSDQPAGALHQAQFALSLGDSAKVEKWALRMLEYDRSSEPVQLAAQLLHAGGNSARAMDVLETALREDPGLPDAWYLLGMLRGENGDFPGAAAAFRRTVAADPEHARAWYNLGLAQIQSGDRQAGLASLGKAESFPDEAADAAYAIATVHLQNGDRDAARDAVTRALTANPRHAPSQRLLQTLQMP